MPPVTPLPIDPFISQIIQAVEERGAAVVVAPPGSGKTTRVPPALLRARGRQPGQVIVLQPRRIAARAAARRIAAENGWSLGGEVGYQVRFDRVAGDDTRLLVITEGILTRRLQADPALAGVAAVVIDEFHERSLHADLTLALLREVRCGLRPDVHVVVMSATLEPGPVAEFLGDAATISVAGRPYHVAVHYLQHSASGAMIDAVERAVHQALAETTGHILVFLPGASEIGRCRARLAARLDAAKFDLLPLHGDLPPDVQDRVFESGARRKVILSTNVAETSLTIDGVTAVVDSGFVRQLRHDPRLGLDRLELRRISQASAEQRAGRAGRTGPGQAYRLWTPAEQRGLEPFDIPEIRRVDLADTVLELRAWGVNDPAAFGWFEAPQENDLRRAEDLLVQLGALEERGGRLTPQGRSLLGLPVHPRLGRLLIEAAQRGHAADGAMLAALLAERDIIRAARVGESRSPAPAAQSGPSDLLLRLDLVRQAERGGLRCGDADRLGLEPRAVDQVRRAARQLQRLATAGTARRESPRGGEAGRAPPEPRDTALLKAVLAAFPDRVVRRRSPGSSEGVMAGGSGVTLAAESVVRRAELLVAVHVDAGRGGPRPGALVRMASAIEPAWLDELFPGAVQQRAGVEFDKASQRVVAREQLLYRGVVLEEKRGGRIDPLLASRELAAAVRRNPQAVLPADDSFARLAARMRCLRAWHPALDLPALDDQQLVEALVELCPGQRSFEDLRRVDWPAVIKARLTGKQRQALEREAPEQFALPSGRRARIRYEEGKPPMLSARIQDLFGLNDVPRLAGGRVACVVEILAPNQRPIQVTQDLASFWRSTYATVRKDLRRRYPKHDWPETPPR